METKKNRLSEAGRLRCSEAGKANVRIALETRRREAPQLKAAITAFESSLEREIGVDATGTTRALILSAVTSFTALFIVQTKLKAARRYRRIESLIDQVTPLVGSLDRTLRALGVERGTPGDNTDMPPRGGIADYLRQQSKPETEESNNA